MKILHVRQTCEREALESHLPVESKPVPLKGGPLSNQVLMWQTGKSFSPKTEYSRLKQTRKTALVRPKRTSLLNTCTQDDSFVLTGGDLRRVFGFLRFRGFLLSFARFIRFSNRSLPPLRKNGNWLEKSSAFSSDRSPLPGLLVQRNNICNNNITLTMVKSSHLNLHFLLSFGRRKGRQAEPHTHVGKKRKPLNLFCHGHCG